MPRLPKLPGANPAASPDVLIAMVTDLRCTDHINLAAALSALGHVEAAESVVAQVSDPIASVAVLAWMAWCSPDSSVQAKWKRRAQSVWDKRDQARSLGETTTVTTLSALALLEDDPTERLAAARAAIKRTESATILARALVALGKLEDAVALLEEKGGWWEGTGWSTGVMSLRDDAFTHHFINHLVAAQRWDLVGRCAKGLVEDDHLFLGTMSLLLALSGRADAPEALATVPSGVLRNAFLGVLVSLPEAVRPAMAALLPALPPHRRAIGEVLMGDPTKAAALMAEEDAAGRNWDAGILAIAQGDAVGLEALSLTSEHAVRRTIIGGLRALAMQGGPEHITPWLPQLTAMAHGITRSDEIPALLADVGRTLCELGCEEPGRALLGEALTMADGMPKGSASWKRNDALERVGCCAIRGGDMPTALQAIRRCTSKYGRATLARRLAMVYLKAGDAFGAERCLSFIKADQHRDREQALQAVLWDSVPGKTCRWSALPTPPAAR